MPNEQTSVPLFTSGEVLTAANMNLSAGTGVAVFATAVTRDAAFGGAGEKVLAEGQLCYLSDSNIVQYYTGAAWATVGPSAASGLVRTGGGTLSGASTTIAANMSATYNTYLVDISNLQNSQGDTMIIQLDLNGTPSTTGYTSIDINANGSTVASSSDTVWNKQSHTTATGQGFQFLLTNPALATPTKMSIISLDLGTPRMRISVGNHTVATAYNQIKLAPNGGTFTSGTVNVYGYALS
jgi:hypothetical protein